MKKLLYINNYHCITKQNPDYPNNHLWAADKLSEIFDVKCATIPGDVIKFKMKGAGFLNNLVRSFIMLVKYFRYPIVYSACGDYTICFALANKLHLGKRKLFMIQHHGGKRIPFPSGYSKILFISSFVKDLFQYDNSKNVNWGGQIEYANRFRGKSHVLEYDFTSAGKSGRDHDCMIKALNGINAKALIISAINNSSYDKDKITVMSGNDTRTNSTPYTFVYEMYDKSKFIVIPTVIKEGKNKYCLSGLTTFVDAVVMYKPVLASDNTNMGIDIEGLGIGMIYKAGNVEDMRNKMQQLLSLSEKDYKQMCDNMKEYSKTHNYDEFCNEIISIIEHS